MIWPNLRRSAAVAYRLIHGRRATIIAPCMPVKQDPTMGDQSHERGAHDDRRPPTTDHRPPTTDHDHEHDDHEHGDHEHGDHNHEHDDPDHDLSGGPSVAAHDDHGHDHDHAGGL